MALGSSLNDVTILGEEVLQDFLTFIRNKASILKCLTVVGVKNCVTLFNDDTKMYLKEITRENLSVPWRSTYLLS